MDTMCLHMSDGGLHYSPMVFPGNPRALRRMNLGMVLRALLSAPRALSQQQLCRLLGFNKATMSTLVAELRARGLLHTTGRGAASRRGGPRPVWLGIREDGAVILGAWIDRLEAQTYALSPSGMPLEKESITFIERQLPEAIPQALSASLERLKRRLRRSKPACNIIAAGIAVGGRVDADTGMVSQSLHLKMRSFPLADRVQRVLGVPTFLEDTVPVLALRESWMDANRHGSHGVFIQALPFIRATLFSNGAIYHGRRGQAGQIGGWLMPSSSGRVKLLADVIDYDLFGMPTYRKKMRDLASPSAFGEKQRFQQVERFIYRAEHGRLTCSEYSRLIDLLCQVVHNIVVFYDPDRIVLNGLPEQYQRAFMTRIRQMCLKYRAVLPLDEHDLCFTMPHPHQHEQALACMVLSRLFQ